MPNQSSPTFGAEQTPTTQAISTTTNEANVSSASETSMKTAYNQPNLYRIVDQALEESVCREVIVATGKWGVGDEVITNMTGAQLLDEDYKQPRLATLDLPSAITVGSNFVSNKLSNIAYIRTEVVVKLRVQATPFQQGVLWLWNHPYEQEVSKQRSHLNEHLRSITSFPGVELNLQSLSRAVEIVIPYTSEYQVINHRIAESLARVSLSVLSPLYGPDDSSVATWSLIASLKNPEFYGMAPNEASLKCAAPRTLTAEPIMTQDGEDEQASKKGIISQVAGTVSGVADLVSNIPVIGTIAKPVSWIAKAVGGVASLFGFSRVRDMEKNSVFSNIPARGFTHTEGIDQSVVLATCPDNQVSADIAFTSEDEMSIAYVGQKPYFYGRAEWSGLGGNDPGDVLGSFPVHPCPYSFSQDFKSKRLYQGPPSAMVTSLFKWWRGNMSIKLNFAKTSFHQGRLLVQYTPYGTAGSQPIEEVFTSIVDISQIDAEGVDIQIPSVMRNKWYGTDDYNGSPIKDVWAGVVTISVLNPLVFAPTVKDSVQLYAWVHWEDLELAEPGTSVRVFTPIDDFDSQQFNIHRSTFSSNSDNAELTVTQPTIHAGDLNLTNATDSWIKAGDTTITSFKDDTVVNWGVALAGPSSLTRDLPIFEDTSVFISTTPADDINDIHNMSVELSGEDDLVCASDSIIIAIQGAFPGTIGSITVDGKSVWRQRVDNGSVTHFEYSPIVLSSGKHQIISTGLTVRVLSFEPATVTPSGNLVEEELIVTQDGVDQSFTSVSDGSSRTSTMGEMVVSLRSLCRRFTTYGLIEGNFTETPLKGVGDFANQRQSLVDIISYMYRFYHGGWRYKFCITSDSLLIVDAAPTNFGEDFDFSGAAHIQNTSLNPIVEIEKPFYNPSEIVAMSSGTFDTSGIDVRSVGGSPLTGFSLKAAADDHTYTFMVGAPGFFK